MPTIDKHISGSSADSLLSLINKLQIVKLRECIDQTDFILVGTFSDTTTYKSHGAFVFLRVYKSVFLLVNPMSLFPLISCTSLCIYNLHFQPVLEIKKAVWKCFLENCFFVFKKLCSKTVFENVFYYLFLVVFIIFSNVFYIFHRTTENT